jgi:hypothetical protein
MLLGWFLLCFARLLASPVLVLDPWSGPPGTAVSAFGQEFTPGVEVSLLWDGVTTVGGGVVGADGTVAIGFAVPADAGAGWHTLILCAFCGQGFEDASADFEVIEAATPTISCEQMGSCTATPSKTSPPTATRTCQQLQNCTATPSLTPSPTLSPSATPVGFEPSSTASATSVPTKTPTPLPSSTPTVTATARPPGVAEWFGGLLGRLGAGLGISTRTPTPIPVDIELVKIEITQGVQCLNSAGCEDNSVGLYERRPTLVRAYLRLNSGPAFINNVSGTLCYGWTYETMCPSPVRPLAPVTVERVSDPVGLFRGRLSSTLNFVVPSDWITWSKSFYLTVNVNPIGERVKETSYENNWTARYAKFGKRRKLDVVFVPFLSNGAISTYEDRWPIVAWLQLAYPTNDIRVWTTGYWLIKDYAFADTSSGGCGRGWGGLLDNLEWFRGSNWQIYYGMVDAKSISGSITGCGRYDGAFVSAGRTGLKDRQPGETAAQEIGHNFERRHAPGSGAGNADGSYPSSDGTVDEFGVDITRMQVYRPGFDFDFMGYGGDEATTWTSLYTWRALAGLLPIAARDTGRHVARPRQTEGPQSEFLVASGWLTSDAIAIDQGFFRLSLAANSAEPLPAGPYTLELVGSDGTVLRERSFGPAADSNATPDESGSFFLREPWIDGTAAVVIRYRGTELARRSLSPNAPFVRLLQPNGGEAWSAAGEQTIRWEASDFDGDRLQVMIDYSRDDGATWQTIANPGPADSFSFDTSRLPGSSVARIRVVVSDGLHTSVDASEAPFSVSDKPPEVFITSVEDGRRLTQGNPLILLAAGSDSEDGPLNDSGYAWSSDRDGDLGQGGFLTAFDLSLGDHTIALQASDSAGQTARHTVHIVVEPPAELEEETPGPTPSGAPLALVLFAGGGILIVGAVAGIMVALRRQRSG